MGTAAIPATRETARAQLALVAEPQLPLLEFAVWGELTRPAELRVATDESAHLVVRLQQHKDRLPFVAVLHATRAGADDLRDLAKRMPAGTAVVVRCRGLEVKKHDSDYVLQALICDDVRCATFTPSHPEQQA